VIEMQKNGEMKWVCSCVQDLGSPAPRCKFCGGKGFWVEKIAEVYPEILAIARGIAIGDGVDTLLDMIRKCEEKEV